MSQYRRLYQPGGTYFFTLVTYQRYPFFNTPENVKHLQMAFDKVKQKHPFTLSAIVILPDHLHCLLTLPKDDDDFSTRLRLIKRYFSIEIQTSINKRKEKEVWQKRFWEHAIRDENDWRNHMDYIHYNPVKHGIVKAPSDWKYSSFNYWVKKGIYKKDWGSNRPIKFFGITEAE